VKLTVVIPTYNRSDLLGGCLRALLDQTLPANRYEILVVDDGSTDSTPQVVKEIGAPESRLRYLRQENKGPAAARNYGVREARSGLIFFTGDDCIADRNLLAQHVEAHDLQRDVAVVGHISWDPEVEITPFMSFLEEGVQFDFGSITDAEDAPFWCFYSSNLSIARRWLDEVGGFDEDFRYAVWEDTELGYRLHQRGLRLVYRSGAHVYHHHATTLERYLVRQRNAGRQVVTFWRKHPELLEHLGIAHAARPGTARDLYQALLTYSYSVGVREALREDGGREPDESAPLWQDGQLEQSGRDWIYEVFGGNDPVRTELEQARRHERDLADSFDKLRKEWDWVTSRRLYRASESLGKWAWRVLTFLRYGRRRSAD
jgi:GT2 family glycosyltransferase